MIYNILAKILKFLAKPVVEKQRPQIVGITGSVGKTSTKEAIYSVLKEKYHNDVVRAYKNLNTDVGLPLVILRIDKTPLGWQWIYVVILSFYQFFKYQYFSKNYPKIMILEYAADKQGDIKYLTDIVRPDVVCITEIGPAHLEFFKTVENVAREKMNLAKNMKPDGIAVLNKDNLLIKKYAKDVHYKKVWFHGSNTDGAKNAAREIGKIFNVERSMVDRGILNIKSIPGRLNQFKGIRDTIILDDTYNASPLSMKFALSYLKDFKKRKRKVAILGDMRELGDASLSEHEKLAHIIANKAQFAILIGSEMCQHVAPILDEMKYNYLSFSNFSEAKDSIVKNINTNDIILIKGSQNKLFLERVTEMLLQDKNDAKYLCRQSKHWKNIKEKTL